MIGWLRGVVVVRDAVAGEIIINVGGVGYQAIVSWQTFVEVPDVGESCELWVHTHVRAEALALFAFATPLERRMFRLLTSVPQVGPRNAIAVLGGFPLPELVQAIAGGERATLERIPGVGKRTAERILLDLREKMDAVMAEMGTESPMNPDVDDAGADDALVEQARAVLINLGWKPKPVGAALERASEAEHDSLDTLVRQALAQLMSR